MKSRVNRITVKVPLLTKHLPGTEQGLQLENKRTTVGGYFDSMDTQHSCDMWQSAVCVCVCVCVKPRNAGPRDSSRATRSCNMQLCRTAKQTSPPVETNSKHGFLFSFKPNQHSLLQWYLIWLHQGYSLKSKGRVCVCVCARTDRTAAVL